MRHRSTVTPEVKQKLTPNQRRSSRLVNKSNFMKIDGQKRFEIGEGEYIDYLNMPQISRDYRITQIRAFSKEVSIVRIPNHIYKNFAEDSSRIHENMFELLKQILPGYAGRGKYKK